MQPNLVDQLEVFLAIAESGSFSAAAKRLGRAVSAVTYGLNNLESHYQITLFDRSGYRPQLTDEGHALLQDAEIIFRRIDRLNARISALRDESDVEIKLAVDAGFDHSLLGRAISELMAEFPHVNLRLKTVHEANAIKELQDGKAQIALLPLQASLPGKGIDGRDIALAQHRIVAAPSHPLASLPDGFPLSALDDHRQIIVTAPDIDMRNLDYRVHVTDVMIVDSFEMQIDLIRRGVVWGFAMAHHVEADVAAGRLRQLHCAAVEHPGILRFGAVWLVKTPPGPAATRLLDLISHHSTHTAPAY